MLSSAAQGSSYVRSELECAVSSKKRILTVVIENFRINEDFLFHIRPAQAIKAYEDWKTAENVLLKTVEHLCAEYQESQIYQGKINYVEKMEKAEGKRKQSAVCCPYCGCSILKRKRLTFDRCFYPKKGKLSRDNVIKAWINGSTLFALFSLLFAVFFLVLLFVASLVSVLSTKLGLALPQGEDSLNEAFSFIVMFISLGISMYIIWLICKPVFKDPSCGIPTNLIDMFLRSMNNSGLKLYSFKCMKCEKYFSVLLPDNEELKDMVSELLEDPNEE
jgi:hypothetical protein